MRCRARWIGGEESRERRNRGGRCTCRGTLFVAPGVGGRLPFEAVLLICEVSPSVEKVSLVVGELCVMLRGANEGENGLLLCVVPFRLAGRNFVVGGTPLGEKLEAFGSFLCLFPCSRLLTFQPVLLLFPFFASDIFLCWLQYRDQQGC